MTNRLREKAPVRGEVSTVATFEYSILNTNYVYLVKLKGKKVDSMKGELARMSKSLARLSGGLGKQGVTPFQKKSIQDRMNTILSKVEISQVTGETESGKYNFKKIADKRKKAELITYLPGNTVKASIVVGNALKTLKKVGAPI